MVKSTAGSDRLLTSDPRGSAPGHLWRGSCDVWGLSAYLFIIRSMFNYRPTAGGRSWQRNHPFLSLHHPIYMFIDLSGVLPYPDIATEEREHQKHTEFGLEFLGKIDEQIYLEIQDSRRPSVSRLIDLSDQVLQAIRTESTDLATTLE